MKTTTITNSILFQSIITICIFSAFGIAQNTLSIEVGDGTIDVLYNSDADIGGFQYTVEGATVTGTSGGDAAANGFMISCNATTCLGFSMTGAVIPAGSGTLVIISADITGEVSLTGIVVSDAAGFALDFSYDSGPEAADYVVEVSNNVFTPDHLDISAGETVQWINIDGFHNVDGSTDTYPNNPDSFYSGSASSDSWTYSFTFDVSGNYDYECNPHASMGMVGTIAVGSGGCTNDMACNYNSEADFDDGSCLNNDCAGVCGGSAEVDECGECGGDGSACASSTIDILYNTTTEIGGFQFNVDGVTILGASGGAAADAGFSSSYGNNTVLGFSFTGATIPAGSGVLVQVEVDGDTGTACLSAVVLSDPVGGAIDNEVTDCFTISQVEIILGCTDDMACNYNVDATEDDGSCTYAEENYDCDGNCTVEVDCFSVCGGGAVVDECGVCGGDGIGGHACDCAGNVDDCAGVCGGSAMEDDCGVCGGDGTSCIPVQLGFGAVSDGNMEITYNSPADIAGFQFNLTGANITSASGGAAGENGFMISSSSTTVIGFSLSGDTVPAGSGVLIELTYEATADQTCIENPVISDTNGEGIDVEIGACVDLDYTCDDVDADGICDDVDDCVGEYDECGVCNGDGIADGACDCAGNVEDCAGECGGTAEVDECGVCGGGGIADGACDCDGNVDLGCGCGEAGPSGCDNTCGSTLELDECGECGGDGIDEGACDCAGNVEDCAGVCGGDAVVDECGECGGDGIDEGACDCAGNVEDCAGECGGTAENCPDWVDCPSCYENTASMTAIVLDALSGNQMYADGDILAAFDDAGNNRGIAILLYPIPFGPYEGTGLYEIQIRGDAAGDAISFKYYDASEDEVLDSGTGYTFVIDDIIGSAVEPHEISVGAITLSIDIASGWNWFSLNVEGDMSIGSVMGSLTSTVGDFIKNASSSSTYYGEDNGWYGGLAEFDVTGMYKFNSANADLLVFSGAPVDPLATPIDLASGWNWLGFTPQNDGPTEDALASATTTAGDFIKNQGASSTYYGPDNGWYGGLDVMAPTEGYMLSVAEGSTLTYPNFGADDALTREKSEKELPIAVSDWEVNYHDFEFNGHITMSIDSREDSHSDYIAAFVGDECRGVAERMYFPFGDSYMYSVMVYSNKTDGEELTFKYYDSAAGDIVEYAETIDFTSDMIVGDGFNTFDLSREGSFSQPKTYGISEAYPNPFNPVTSFEYTLEKDGMVQVAIYDISGRMVSELVNGYQSAGSYPVVWDAQELSSGVYMVNMISGDYSTIQKVMLIK